jgi:DNA-binding transcriptional regulator YiaG
MRITGETLKAARAGVQESQTAFAARFGVDQATISRWETDGPPESGMAARLIERVLGDLTAPESAEARSA